MATEKERRILVLDTSVFVHDPNCIEAFPDDILVVSSIVINGLDSLKWDEGERGEHARRASWNIYTYCMSGDIQTGVVTKSGGMIKTAAEWKPNTEVRSDTDNEIISLAQHLKQQSPESPVSIVSKNVNLHIRASMCGISSITYDGGDNVHDPYAIFPGYFHILLKDRSPIVEIHRNQWIDLASVMNATDDTFDGLVPNQCVYLNFANDGGTLAIYKKDQGFRLVPKPKQNGKQNKMEHEVNPRSCEQAFAYSLLMDPDIKLVVLIGSEGSGKTLMSLLAAYRQLRSEFEGKIDPEDGPLYGKMMVFRPNIEKGQPLGFLPGVLGEKFEPWMAPVFDNMNLFLPPQKKGSAKHISPVIDLMDNGTLEILPINYMRGRSVHDAFIVVDDAQNLKQDELKMLITRPAEGSKVVLTGGLSQIDHPYMNKYSNGLSRVISAFMGQEIFGYAIMKQSEQRSMIAKLAAELL